ncbi:MAG: DUF805 domain-containing protein [Bacteroidota bacterium]
MHWYFKIIKENYASFEGRTGRSEFWKFYVVTVLLFVITILLDLLIIALSNDAMYAGFISLIFALFMFLPVLAATVRRLHDTGKSGWYMFLNLIPLFGGVAIMIMLLIPGQKDSNKYGPKT